MDPSPRIPAFHFVGHSMGVRRSAFRVNQCTPHVLEATKTSYRPRKKNGNQINYLPRRHAHYGSIQRLSRRTHYHITVNLLSSLGIVLNEGKSVLVPTQELEFLAFLINSVEMSLYLPREKVKSIKRECQSMINNPSVSIRTLSRLLGKLSSSIQAVFPAPLHYCFLLMAKTMALKKTQSYEPIVFLNQAAQEELL